MGIISKTLIILTIIVAVYSAYHVLVLSSSELIKIGSSHPALYTILSIIGVLLVTAFIYHVFPIFFDGVDIAVAIMSVYTVSNFTALFLSWYYFNNTHCWRNEANPIMRKMTIFFGEDISHFIGLILRALINVFFLYLVLGGFVRLDGESNKILLALFSFSTAIYVVEMIGNFIANFSDEVYVCKNVSTICKKYNVACDVPALVKEKMKEIHFDR